MKANAHRLTFILGPIHWERSPKNNIRAVSSALGRPTSCLKAAPNRADALWVKDENRTVGGNELKAARCTHAARRGAQSYQHVPPMSAVVSPNGSPVRHLTTADVSNRFGVSRRTIERQVADGHFPSPIRLGRVVRFLEADIIAFEQRAREPKAGGQHP
jgi:excisionase family DNA binding protein